MIKNYFEAPSKRNGDSHPCIWYNISVNNEEK